LKRNYKFSNEDAEIINRQISDMLKMGVIEKSTSHRYNSPCFLVAKKSGEKGFVIDLRELNSINKLITVQLSKLNKLIDSITSQNCKYISACNL